MPLSQLGVLTWAESAEKECPCEKDGEGSEEEVVVSSSARRRLNNLRHGNLRRRHESGDRPSLIASFVDRPPVVVGHQLANGLRAPLLV
jgi:hypothetical protein